MKCTSLVWSKAVPPLRRRTAGRCLLQLKTAAWLLQGSLRAADRATLSNLSVHTGIELVLNLLLSFLRAGRFALFIPKFTSRRDEAALSPTQTATLRFAGASERQQVSVTQQKRSPFVEMGHGFNLVPDRR